LRLRLPFNITNVVGETRDDRGRRAILFSFVYGNSIDLTSLPGDDPVLDSIAKATAAVHALPIEMVETAGLPQYSPQESIRLKVSELDRAAQTGKIPPKLLQRWETAFEDVALFKYQPCVVHGDLNSDHVLETEGQVSGLLDFSNLKVGDPAEDLSWVVGAHNPDAAYAVLLDYQNYRQLTDPFLRPRAQLYSELEVASWLLYGFNTKDQDIVRDAVELLEELVNDLDAGALPQLTSTPVATPVASAEPTFTAPMPVIAMADEPLPMPVVDEPAIEYSMQNDESDASEAVASEPEPQDINDLPAFLFGEDDKDKKDNELF
ncbi:MAG: phosphotransferase, partial [Micrococcales bacterium]